MANPKLAMIPTGYKAGKVYSVLPESGVGDFTFDRDSKATRVNENGLIETMDNDVPRLDYTDGGCPSLLLEPESTNNFIYSNEFSNVSWSKSSSGIDKNIGDDGINENIAISPDGSLNSDRVNFLLQSDRDSGLAKSVSSSAGATWVTSIWLKGEGSNIGKSISIRVKRSSGGNYVGEDETVELTAEWVRHEVMPVTLITDNNGVRFIISSNDATSCLIWGAQQEEQDYATSYIPTTSTAVTRVGETCTNSGNAATFNDSEGVLMAEISALADDFANYKFISLSDGTFNNFCDIYYGDASNRISVRFRSGSGSVINMFLAVSDVSVFNKIAISWKLNEFKFFVNGIRVGLNTSGAAPTDLNTLNFNSTGIPANPLYGNTKQLQYFDSALTDSEIETLTSWASFTEMANAQNYTII